MKTLLFFILLLGGQMIHAQDLHLVELIQILESPERSSSTFMSSNGWEVGHVKIIPEENTIVYSYGKVSPGIAQAWVTKEIDAGCVQYQAPSESIFDTLYIELIRNEFKPYGKQNDILDREYSITIRDKFYNSKWIVLMETEISKSAQPKMYHVFICKTNFKK